MEDKLLSVVVPTYNAQNFIRYALESLVNQTYKNLEIIIVDDGSSDNTVGICREYEARDSRVKVYTHENMGVSATRNEGIEHATGEYIFFCDADDYPEENLAECYINAINKWNGKAISFVACGMFFDNVYNRHVKDRKYVLEYAHGYLEGEYYVLSRNFAATLAWLELFNFVTNKCYDLNFLKESNIRFDENIHIGEDLKFNLDILDKCAGNIGMINMALYHYVKRTDSNLSISYHINDLEDTKAIFKRFLEWEKIQDGVTEENVLVVKSIYVGNWVCRLTSYYEESKKNKNKSECVKVLKKEIMDCEFQTMLKEIYKARKISPLRYWCLKLGNYETFYFFRSIYQIIKG